MLTYQHRQPAKDAQVLAVINDVIEKHPAWGVRLIHGWVRENDHPYTEGCIRRVYRQAGHAAQWRKRRRKVRTGERVRPVAEVVHDVWCMDFAEDRLMNGRKIYALVVKDEATAYGLDIRVARSFKGVDVEDVLDELVERYGAPRYIRSDNGGQFIAYVVQSWARRREINLAYIEPGKPWQNGHAESFVGTYKLEVLNAEVFASLHEAAVITRQWLHMYNTERPHSRHNYRPPATAYTPKKTA